MNLVTLVLVLVGGLFVLILFLAILGLFNWRWFAIAAPQPTLLATGAQFIYWLSDDALPPSDLMADFDIVMWWVLQVSLLAACALGAMLAWMLRGIRLLWRRRASATERGAVSR